MALSKWIRTLLYGITEYDVVSFSLAPVLLASPAICASLFPMYHAVTIDPVQSLREG